MHRIDSHLLQRSVKIALVGAGGSGSQMLSGLARLHHNLMGLGHPGGFDVHVFDPDWVSETNVGRQLFYVADIGLNKASVLVHRLNVTFGLNWRASESRFESSHHDRYDFVIGCVDTAKSRAEIAQYCARTRCGYWLDLGNRASDGQCVLGEPLHAGSKDWYMRLPTVVELFPALLNAEPEDDTPSCSLAEALEKQELFINQAVVTQGLNLLWQLFRNGEIRFATAFIDLKGGRNVVLPIDRDAWRRFGFKGARKPRTRINTASS